MKRASAIAKRKASTAASLRWSLATLIGLIALKIIFEHTAFVQYLEGRAYLFLQRRIVTGGTTKRPDVLIVDITKIEPRPWTSRERLQKLIEVFTDLGAKSVGVDVDFSPEKQDGVWKPIDPNDLDETGFFEWCRKRSVERNIPIALGIFRTDPNVNVSDSKFVEWLGDPKFRDLAATIAVKRNQGFGYDLGLLWTIHYNHPLPSMGAALARLDFSQSVLRVKSFWNWGIETTSIENGSGEIVIDYAPLQRIREDVLPALPPEFFREMEDKIRNRIILLGDTKPGPDDFFEVPGVPEKVRGVFLHACVANTILNGPLLRLTLLGRIAIDVGLALLVLAAVHTSIWLRSYFKYPLGRLEDLLKSFIFTFLAIAFVLIVSISWIRWTRLLWTDFLLVCVVLLMQLILDVVNARRLHPSNCEPE